MVQSTEKLVAFGSVFLRKSQLLVQVQVFAWTVLVLCGFKPIKTRIPFDNRLSDYRLKSTEIMLWNMNDNKTN